MSPCHIVTLPERQHWKQDLLPRVPRTPRLLQADKGRPDFGGVERNFVADSAIRRHAAVQVYKAVDVFKLCIQSEHRNRRVPKRETHIILQ
ncbi:unnamed protein product [Dicrocoelium dendriticum]|nr:unnamed protein product [Dicrocoelium dendriticum]